MAITHKPSKTLNNISPAKRPSLFAIWSDILNKV
jgi:hypothetical protein